MSTTQNIITRVRDTLADPNGDRWDDDRIIREINAAQKDICLKANILRAKTMIALNPNRNLYNLLPNTLNITRILYGNINIPLKSHEEMDIMDINWETRVGSAVEYIVYDKTNMGQIKIYPMLDSASGTSAYGTVATVEDADFDSAYGIVTAIGTIEDSNSVEIVGDRLTIYYLSKPETITVVTDNISIDDIWDTAIKHYVCGILLRDDADTQNRAFGNEELSLYAIELAESIRVSSKDFTGTNQYETTYRGGI